MPPMRSCAPATVNRRRGLTGEADLFAGRAITAFLGLLLMRGQFVPGLARSPPLARPARAPLPGV